MHSVLLLSKKHKICNTYSAKTMLMHNVNAQTDFYYASSIYVCKETEHQVFTIL